MRPDPTPPEPASDEPGAVRPCSLGCSVPAVTSPGAASAGNRHPGGPVSPAEQPLATDTDTDGTDRRGQPGTWSPILGWRPAESHAWIAEVEEVAALLLRWEIAAAHLTRAAADRAVLSVPEFLALWEIASRPVPLTGATVADIVGVGSGGVSGILTRLEEQELIEREPDPDDARGMVSFATEAGRALLHDGTDDLPGTTFTDLLRGMTLEQVRLVASFVGLVVDRAYRRTRHVRRLDRKR